MLVWLSKVSIKISVLFLFFVFSAKVQALPVYRSKIEVPLVIPENLLPAIKNLRPRKLSYPTYYRIPIPNLHRKLPYTIPLERKRFWDPSVKTRTYKLRIHYTNIFEAFKYYGDFSARGFLQIFEPGKKYNFVITSSDLIIVETIPGDKRFVWHSKHALAAGFAHRVHFAGEIWQKNRKILINNHSESYKSDEAITFRVADFLEQTMGIAVHTECKQEPFLPKI